jgi:serine/threonine protein phosphatase PrpC
MLYHHLYLWGYTSCKIGHGEEGHHCASYAKKILPQQLAKYIRQSRVQKYSEVEGKKKGAWNPKLWPLLDKDSFEQCCRRAFLSTNKALHDEEAVSKCNALR